MAPKADLEGQVDKTGGKRSGTTDGTRTAEGIGRPTASASATPMGPSPSAAAFLGGSPVGSAPVGSARGLHTPAERLSTPELIKEIPQQLKQLVVAQLDLAKVELRSDLAREGKMVAGMGVAALATLITVNLLLVTGILTLATVMPGWAAGLCVSGVVLLVAIVAGSLGWSKRVRRPLARTRREIEQDVKLTKDMKLSKERTTVGDGDLHRQASR